MNHQTTAVVFSAPQAWGKTRNSDALLRRFGKTKLVDDWAPYMPMQANALHLTNTHPYELEHLRCRVVAEGWGKQKGKA